MKYIILFILIFFNISFSQYMIDSNVKAYWNVNQGLTLSGSDVSIWTDQSDSSFAATSVTCPIYYNDGDSISFNGTNDFLAVVSAANIEFGTGAFTLELFIKIGDSSSTEYYFNKRSTARWWFRQTGSKLECYGRNDLSIDIVFFLTTSAGIFRSETWYYIAFVTDRSTAKIYINGDEQNVTITNLNANNVTAGAVELAIGTRSVSHTAFFSGCLGEIRWSTKARSQPEIMAYWNYLQKKYVEYVEEEDEQTGFFHHKEWSGWKGF